MIDPTKLPPAVQRALLDEDTRRSLLTYHRRAFAISHGGQSIMLAPYIDAMCHAVQQVGLGNVTRQIITVPPRHGKSEITCASFGSWMLGQDPTIKIMVASYGLELSGPQIANARRLIGTADYARVFPKTKIQRGKDRGDVFGTTAGGEMRAVSQGGAVTGHGADILIVDDLSKADEALTPAGRAKAITFYTNTLPSRFDNPMDGRIIVIQQRLHEYDLVGFLLGVPGFQHLNLPAIAEEDQTIPLTGGQVWHRKKGELLHPERISLEYLNEQRLIMGPRGYGAQYQQNPIASDGSLIHLEWFGQYETEKHRLNYHKMVQSWDPAITQGRYSDYSVGMTWGYQHGKWYLLDLIREKLEFPALRQRMIDWHVHWKADALIIEGASIGHALWAEAKRAGLPGTVICPTPKLSKVDRLAARTAQLATGDYHLPVSAPWLTDLRHELVAFPDGAHDDQVDALTQFLEFVFDRPRWPTATYDALGRKTDPIIRSTRRPLGYG